jgi:hypothetical protein
MSEETQLELPISTSETEVKRKDTIILSVTSSRIFSMGLTGESLFSLFKRPWYLFPPVTSLISILERMVKIYQLEENAQQVILIKRQSISFTPMCHFPLRELKLSSVLNN